MSTTLSKGYKVPSVGDEEWYADLEANIQRLNDHNHDDVNSQALELINFQKATTSILASNWGADLALGGSRYSQTITMPAGYEFDSVNIVIRTAAGGVIYPTLAKASTNTFTITVNDNTLDLVALYV